MKVDIEVDTDELHTKTVDQQGRLYLSQKHAGKEVEFVVLEVNDDA